MIIYCFLIWCCNLNVCFISFMISKSRLGLKSMNKFTLLMLNLNNHSDEWYWNEFVFFQEIPTLDFVISFLKFKNLSLFISLIIFYSSFILNSALISIMKFWTNMKMNNFLVNLIKFKNDLKIFIFCICKLNE
jgi:hypothetical protein